MIGNDPPGTFTRALHPRYGRHDDPPPDVIPVGRTVIVPANGSLPNIVLTPQVTVRLKRSFARGAVRRPAHPRADDACDLRLDARRRQVRDGGDVACVRRAQLDAPRAAVLGLPHGPDRLPDRRLGAGAPLGGEVATRSGVRGDPERRADPAARGRGQPRESIVFIGRHDKRKGMSVLLEAWPEIHRRTGRASPRSSAPIRSPCGSFSRGTGSPHTGIDMLGFLSPGRS